MNDEDKPKNFYQRETRSLNGAVRKTTTNNHTQDVSKKEKASAPQKKVLLKVKMTRPLYKDLIASRAQEKQKQDSKSVIESPQPANVTATPIKDPIKEQSILQSVKLSPVKSPVKAPKPVESPKPEPVIFCDDDIQKEEIVMDSMDVVDIVVGGDIEQTPNSIQLTSHKTAYIDDHSKDNNVDIKTQEDKIESKPKIPSVHISKNLIETRDLNPGTRRTSGIIGTGKETNLFGRPRKDTLIFDEKNPCTIEEVVGCELHWRGLKIAAKVTELSNPSDLIEHFEIWKFKNAGKALYDYFSSLPPTEYVKYSRKERMKDFLSEVMKYKEQD